MANNQLPKPFDQLDISANLAITGLKAQEKALHIKQNTSKVLTSARSEARKTESAFQRSVSQGARKVTPVFQSAESDARATWKAAKKVLQLRVAWAETGLVAGTLAAPSRQKDLEPVLLSLAEYFTTNPTHEVAELDVTAEYITAVHDRLSAARADRDTYKEDHKKLKSARDKATNTLRKRLRGLFHELETLLERDDTRWTKFGFAPPASKTPPAPKPRTRKPKANAKAKAADDRNASTASSESAQKVQLTN